MAINIDGTIYRNIQQQVAKNTDDIDKLKKEGSGGTVDAYTKAESDAKFQTIAGMTDYATKTELNAKQDTLTAGDGIDITSNVIAIDNTVALKTDIPTVEKKTLVWTNPNPNSGFDPQVSNPELNMTGITNPKYLEIEWKDSSSTAGIRVNRFGWNDTNTAYNYLSQINMNSAGTYITGRRFYISKITEINKTYAIFDDAYRSAGFQTASANNSNVIPYKIYVIE